MRVVKRGAQDAMGVWWRGWRHSADENCPDGLPVLLSKRQGDLSETDPTRETWFVPHGVPYKLDMSKPKIAGTVLMVYKRNKPKHIKSSFTIW